MKVRHALSALLALPLLAAPAHASFPGANGAIGFDSDRLASGNDELFAQPLGAAAKALTAGAADERFITFSPDGSRIAYFSDVNGANDIYGAFADGTAPVRLTDNGADDEDPAFLDDGRIAFESNRDGNFEIYVMDADGGNETRLTNQAGNDTDPTRGPAGGILFSSVRDGGDFDIFTMEADGDNPVNLTSASAAADFQADLSPNGATIAFSTDRDDVGPIDDELYTMTAAGGSQTRVTNLDSGDDDDPAWAPDGTRLAFESERNGGADDIWIMDPDGSDLVNHTANTTGEDENPEWQPLLNADVTVGATATAAVTTGGEMTLTATVGNSGPTVAAPSGLGGVTLTQALPATFALRSWAISRGSCTPSAGLMTCTIGRLPQGETSTLTIVGVATGPGGLATTATVVAPNPDPDAADNSATTNTAVTDPPAAPAVVPPAASPPTVTPPAALPAFSKVATLPSTKRCASRRSFRIRLRVPTGVKVREAVVRVNGKRVAVRRGAGYTAPVNLKGLPRGRFTVTVTITLADGGTIKGTRKYRTCAAKRKRAG